MAECSLNTSLDRVPDTCTPRDLGQLITPFKYSPVYFFAKANTHPSFLLAGGAEVGFDRLQVDLRHRGFDVVNVKTT
jgi:hypothetical protein